MSIALLIVRPECTQASERGSYEVYGEGGSSCGKFVSARDGARTNERDGDTEFGMLSWAMGSLTMFNYSTPNTYSILGNTDANGAELWLYNYCTSHPLATFASAVNALIYELKPSRQTRPPVPY